MDYLCDECGYETDSLTRITRGHWICDKCLAMLEEIKSRQI